MQWSVSERFFSPHISSTSTPFRGTSGKSCSSPIPQDVHSKECYQILSAKRTHSPSLMRILITTHEVLLTFNSPRQCATKKVWKVIVGELCAHKSGQRTGLSEPPSFVSTKFPSRLEVISKIYEQKLHVPNVCVSLWSCIQTKYGKFANLTNVQATCTRIANLTIVQATWISKGTTQSPALYLFPFFLSKITKRKSQSKLVKACLVTVLAKIKGLGSEKEQNNKCKQRR